MAIIIDQADVGASWRPKAQHADDRGDVTEIFHRWKEIVGILSPCVRVG